MKIFVNSFEIEELFLTDNFEIEVIFDSEEYIGLETAHLINTLFLEIKGTGYKGNLLFTFTAANQEIDICVPAAMILFMTEFPSVRLVLNMSFQHTIGLQSEFEFKLRQYFHSALLSFENLNIYFQKNKGVPYKVELNGHTSSDLHSSSKFLPIISINCGMIEQIFRADLLWNEKMSLLDEQHNILLDEKPNPKDNINHWLFSKLRKSIFEQNTNLSLQSFALESYARLLTEMRALKYLFNDRRIFDGSILDIALKENDSSPFKTRSATGKNFTKSSSYFEIIKSVDRRLKEKGTLFTLLYSTCVLVHLKNIRSSDRVQLGFIQGFEKKLNEIFEMVEDISTGLYELFQNICEHSSSKRGIFTARIFDLGKINKFKSGMLPDVTSYTKSFSNYGEQATDLQFLDINIMDLASSGITETYMLKSKGSIKLKDIYSITSNTPLHSKQRLDENIGLLLFNRKIQDLKGYFYVSTPVADSADSYNSFSSGSPDELVFFYSGSHYSILSPLFTEVNKPLGQFKIDYAETINNRPPSEETTNPVWQYILTDAFAKNQNPGNVPVLLNIEFSQFSLEKNTRKYGVEEGMIALVIDAAVRNANKKNIIVLDFSHCDDLKIRGNVSVLKRFINHLEYADKLLIPTEDFILTGLNFSTFQNLMELLRNARVWLSFKRRYLFYLAKDDYYIPVVLFGKDYTEFKQLNKAVTRLDMEPAGSQKEFFKTDENRLTDSALTYQGRSLKEFDILLRDSNSSYFEIFAKKCLETEIDAPALTGTYTDHRLQGYKIAGGHFKLGSKIHISDFYYAKRMFQINDFAYKFALLVTQYLSTAHDKVFKRILRDGVTILGYAKYSDLLIYQVTDLIKLVFGNAVKDMNIDMNIITDTETPELMFGKTLKQNVVLIVPISSTFSTSFKIDEFISANLGKGLSKDIPVINLINVAHAPDHHADSSKGHYFYQPGSISSRFGWYSHDVRNKIIGIRDIDATDTILRPQKYFIQLFTTWNHIDDCSICFQGASDQELPLIETDKASVTPQLIFGNGPTYSWESSLNARQARLTERAHFYGHYDIDNRHHVHFIDPREYLKSADKDGTVQKWLQDLKAIWKFQINGIITLITPDGVYNSEFVHLVNKIMFDDRANIIKYDASNDFFANFRKFYANIVIQSDHLIYVDDQISTGNTFEIISNFIGGCTRENEKIKFSALLTLISRMDDEPLEQIRKMMRYPASPKANIEWFKYIRVPTVVSSHLACPICTAQKNYMDIAENASLDPTKYYLFKKANKLQACQTLNHTDKQFHSYDQRISDECLLNEIDGETPGIINFFNLPYRRTHLLKLIVENNLYRLKLLDNIERVNDLDIDVLTELVYAEFLEGYEKQFDKRDILLMLLKVLSFAPFVNHYAIRKIIFNKLNQLLDNWFQSLKEDPIITVERLRELNLLLKRVSHLKGNYLLRRQNFSKLLIFYKAHELTKLEEKGKSLDTLIETHLWNIIRRLNLFESLKDATTFLNEQMNFNSTNYKGEKSSCYYQAVKRISNRLTELQTQENTAFEFYAETILDVLGKFRQRSLELIQKKSEQLVSFPEDDRAIHELMYSCRSLKNLDYKRKVRSDFHYFIAHLVKEVVHNNEPKAIHLDWMITTEYQDLKKTDINIPLNFRQLLRILKLENTGILKLKSGLFIRNIQLEESFEEKTVSQNIRKILEQFSRKDFNERQVNLLSFLNQEFEACDEKTTNEFNISDSFMHYILLRYMLEWDAETIHSRKVEAKSLQQKLQYILSRLCAILFPAKEGEETPILYDPIIFIRYKQIVRGTNIAERDLFYYPKKIRNISLENSFTLPGINGLSLREGGGMQNMFEFIKSKDSRNWESLKSYYTTADGAIFQDTANSHFLNDKAENDMFDKKYSHILMQRISEFRLHQNGEIDNNGQAIILIASTRKDYLKPEKLRYLTLIRDLISAFLKKHYTTDTFTEYIRENTKNYEWNAYTHGWESANEAMKKLIETTYPDLNTRNRFELAQLLLVQSTIVRHYQLASSEIKITEEISFDELKKMCIETGEYIFGSTYYKPKGTSRKLPNIEFDFQRFSTFMLKKDLLVIILAEIFHNFKNNSYILDDGEISCSISLIVKKDKYFLSIVNSYAEDEIRELENSLQKQTDQERAADEQAHGTEMIRIIYKSIFNNEEYSGQEVNLDGRSFYGTLLPIFDVK